MVARFGPLAGLFFMSLILAGVASLDAAVLTVTKLTDSNDGLCNADCSLREAIRAANVMAGMDTISLPAGTLTLSLAGRSENMALTGDLDVLDDLEIRGQGAEITLVDGNDLDRVFHNFAASVEIAELSILGGRAEDQDHGAAIANEGTLTLRDVVARNNIAAAGGGAIFNTSVMLIERSTVFGNTVTASSGNGGGIENTGDLEVVASTINDNETNGFSGSGGGLMNLSVAILRNTTISGNSTKGSFGDGGGIHTSNELTLLNCTLHGNSAGGDGNAIGGIGFRQTFTNSLISGDCDHSSATVSQGGNLESPGSTCGFGGGDQENVTSAALALGPLADNGGPTRTHALPISSAAIDRALNGTCPAQDQRLQTRPADGDSNGSAICDVGAFELGGAVDPSIFLDGFESGTTDSWSRLAS